MESTKDIEKGVEEKRAHFGESQKIKVEPGLFAKTAKKDDSIVITHPDGRAAIHTADGAWIDLDFRSPEERNSLFFNYVSDERELKSLPSKGIKDTIIDFLVTVWPLTLLLAIGILVLPAHGLSWLLDECTTLSDKKCTEYACWLTVAFWLLIVAGIFFHKWIKKTGRQYKTFILEPIRYLRTLFRRLEKATRPPENC